MSKGQTEMTDSPFTPFSATLQRVLRRKFIRGAAKWLIGETSYSVLAQSGSSAWEAAMTLLFLSRARAAFQKENEEAELCAVIAERIPPVARWLLERYQTDGDGNLHWEGVTWDTAVIVRCLLEVARDYPASFTDEELRAINDSALSATKWLCNRFTRWESSIKYPFGPADVAQILILLVYEAEHSTAIYSAATTSTSVTPQAITEYLLHTRTFMEDESGSPRACWWDDYFNTAEVLDALGAFYAAPLASSKRSARLLATIKQASVGTCAYLETTQTDAMWGSHIDTIRTLQAYVTLPKVIRQQIRGESRPLLIPEPHTTFKALRWICDEKQIFTDGSMLHTTFLTVFYAHALMSVHDCWEPAARTIEALYDDVLWATPVRSTPERLSRHAAEIRLGDLTRTLEEAEIEAKDLREAVRDTRARSRKLFLCSAIALLSIPASIMVSQLLGFSKFAPGFEVLDAGEFASFVFGAISSVALLITLIWNLDSLMPPRRGTE